jgi:hypothetical protein
MADIERTRITRKHPSVDTEDNARQMSDLTRCCHESNTGSRCEGVDIVMAFDELLHLLENRLETDDESLLKSWETSLRTFVVDVLMNSTRKETRLTDTDTFMFKSENIVR